MLAVRDVMTGPIGEGRPGRVVPGGQSDLTLIDVRRWLRYYVPCFIERDPAAFVQRQEEINAPKIERGVLMLEPQRQRRPEAKFERLSVIRASIDDALDANWPGMTALLGWPYLADDQVKRLPLLGAAVWVFLMRGPSRPDNVTRPPAGQRMQRYQNLPQKEAERLLGHHWTRIDKAWKAGSAQVFRATRQRVRVGMTEDDAG